MEYPGMRRSFSLFEFSSSSLWRDHFWCQLYTFSGDRNSSLLIFHRQREWEQPGTWNMNIRVTSTDMIITDKTWTDWILMITDNNLIWLDSLIKISTNYPYSGTMWENCKYNIQLPEVKSASVQSLGYNTPLPIIIENVQTQTGQ